MEIFKTEDKTVRNIEEMNTKTKDLQGLIDELKKTQTRIANSEIEMAVRVNELYTEWITIFGKLTKVHRHRSCDVISSLAAEQNSCLPAIIFVH